MNTKAKKVRSKHINIYSILCVLMTLLFLFSSVQTTLAAWRVSDESIHAISIASLSGKIVEQYEEPDDLKPGRTVDKIVNVKNTGEVDSVVRVRVEKYWGKSRTEDGTLIHDLSFDTDNILIDFDTEYWYYNSKDDYFYYKGVLEPGQTTLKPLFKYFRISNDTDNRYDNMMADIVVKMECIQAASNAISVWGTSLEELGIQYVQKELKQDVSKVSFIGRRNGFAFDPADTDLFKNFKNLAPGEARTQKTTVTNITTDETEIFLRAAFTEQVKTTPETLELINRLLKEYVTIVVTDDNGKVIYDGPVWGKPLDEGGNPDTMRYDISLGLFGAGKTKNLTIQLQVSPQVDNQYQSLWGFIKWIWSAQGTDSDVPVTPPQTGESGIAVYVCMMLVSGIVLIVLLRQRQRGQYLE